MSYVAGSDRRAAVTGGLKMTYGAIVIETKAFGPAFVFCVNPTSVPSPCPRRGQLFKMAKEDLLPFKYDSKTNTVFNTSGAKIVPVVRTKLRSKSWLNTFFDLSTR